METFKTPKGTTLPLLDLRGKKYLQVAHRIVWFREEHADWSIETDVKCDKDAAVARAIIRDVSGRVIATSTKYENKQGFGDFIEKSETGAIGRALALCGYGTQFTTDLDEGERLADSPIEAHTGSRGKIHDGPTPVQPNPPIPNYSPAGSGSNSGLYRIPFGKHTQKTLGEVGAKDLAEYVIWLENKSEEENKPPRPPVKDFIERAAKFIADFERQDDVPF